MWHKSLLVLSKILFTFSVSYSLDIILQIKIPKRVISEVARHIWHTWMLTRSQYSQLKMPGGGCSVTSRQFSSSLLSPQSFCWLQISEPRYKHLPLAQVNLHSERQKKKNCEKIDAYPSSVLKWQSFSSRCYNGGWVSGISTPTQTILSLQHCMYKYICDAFLIIRIKTLVNQICHLGKFKFLIISNIFCSSCWL